MNVVPYWLTPTNSAALALLAIVPPVIWLWLNRPRRAVSWPGVNLLSLPPSRRIRPELAGAVLRTLTLTVLAMAVAGTVGGDVRPGVSIVLVVDVSGSMAEVDFERAGGRTSRLDAAKGALIDWIRRRPDDRFGLVPFAAHPEEALPPTSDHAAVVARLNGLRAQSSAADSTSNLGDAIAVGLAAAGSVPGRAVLIFVSDGEHNVPAPALTVRQAAQLAGALGVPVWAIDPAPDVDSELRRAGRSALTALAELTGGAVFAASDSESMADAIRAIDAREPGPAGVAVVRRASWATVGLLALFSAVILERFARRRTPPSDIGWSLAPVLAITSALLWPSETAPSPESRGRDLVFAVDVSRSMLAPDAPPNRFVVARNSILRLLDSRSPRPGDRFAVVAFAARSTVWVPLTNDPEVVRSGLLALDPAVPPKEIVGRDDAASGTRIGDAIRTAAALIPTDRRRFADVVLLSDGDDPAGDGEWLVAKSAPVPVHAVGVGRPDRDAMVPGLPAGTSTRLIETPLREIAAATGGTYRSWHSAAPELPEWHRRTLRPKPTAPVASGPILGQPAWPYLLAFLVTAGAIGGAGRLGGRWRSIVAALPLVPIACGPPEPSPFQRGWQLAAAGRHREAAELFRQIPDDSTARYNQGTCALLASNGNDPALLREAVEALEQARTVGPDARTNLELAKRLLAVAPTESPPEAPPGGDRSSERPAEHNGDDNGLSVQRAGRSTAESNMRSHQPEANENSGHSPGSGALPPIPDEDRLAVSPSEAPALLQREIARIRAARDRTRAAPATHYPDW